MKDYEIIGRCYEISLALDIDVIELLEVKYITDKRGFTADDKHRLSELGISVKFNTFNQCIIDFSNGLGLMSKGIIGSNFYQLKKETKRYIREYYLSTQNRYPTYEEANNATDEVLKNILS